MYKKVIAILALALTFSVTTSAQLDFGRLAQGGAKLLQAVQVSDNDIIAYVHEYITKTDAENKIADANSTYGKRLAKLTKGLTQVEGIPLNFKVYIKDEVNAFACADGSVRIYSGLMDVMNDNEVLGVIGHEMGHVAHKDTKKAFKQALINQALKDGIASTNSTVAHLTDSQLGALGDALSKAKYSQKQENNADDYGYDFLKKNGKNPASMVWSFRKLQQIEQASGAGNTSAINQLFSSHPQLSKRIQRMEKKATKDGYSIEDAANVVETEKTTSSSKTGKSGKSTKSSKSSKSTKTSKKK